MKKILMGLLVTLCTLSVCIFASCGKATIESFTANEDLRYVEIGENYNVPKPTIKTSKGKYLTAEVTAKDPDGKDVKVTNYKFTPDKLGVYTVTYTVTLGEETQTKSYELEVYDETEPLVDLPLMWYNITMPGSTLDITEITAKDNSGERVTPVVTVYFDGEVVEPIDDIITFDEIGTYIVNVYCEDPSGNEEDRDYYVWTSVTYEDGEYVDNEWYPNDVRDYLSHNGEKSMEIRLFSNHVPYNWFNDSSLLGELYFYGNTDEKPYTHVSYWIYFDFMELGINATAAIKASWYQIEGVYDVYGNSVKKNNADEYEFSRNTWYRIVTDVTKLDDPYEHPEATPITDCLLNYGIYFGLWNSDTGGNVFEEPVSVYLDDIRLIDIENDDEVYYPHPMEIAKEYDKGDRLAYVQYSQMVIDVAKDKGQDVTLKDENDNELVTYNFKHGLVDDTLSNFEYYSSQQIGLDSSEFEEDDEKMAFTSGWKIHTGNSDGFVYEITAKDTVFIDLKAQVREDLGKEGFDDDELGVDKSEGNTDGWVDGSSRLRIFLKEADGNLVLLYDYRPSKVTGVDEKGNPCGYDLENILLQEGQTLYYEYSFPYQDHRTIENPPYLNVYTATKKSVE